MMERVVYEIEYLDDRGWHQRGGVQYATLDEAKEAVQGYSYYSRRIVKSLYIENEHHGSQAVWGSRGGKNDLEA